MASHSESRSLVFSDQHAAGGYALMEMTEDMLKVLSEEGSFSIKGTETEEAVLCTKTSSFIVREAPSSNSILLMESHPLKSGNPETIIIQTLHSFYQLNRTSANTEKLKDLLNPTALNFPDFDQPCTAKCYNRADLENNIQCSGEELGFALKSLAAVEYGGHLRVLSLDAEYVIAKHVVLTMGAGGMDEKNLNREDLLEQAKDKAFPSNLLAFVIDSYLVPNDSTTTSSMIGSELFSFNERKYAVLVAHFLLKLKQTSLLSAFMTLLKDRLPSNIHTSLDASVLDGLACFEEQGSDIMLTFLPAASLPHNPKIRLAELFKLKPKWTFAQLKPYLQDLLSLGTNEEQILVAHTRSSNGPGGVKLYSSR